MWWLLVLAVSPDPRFPQGLARMELPPPAAGLRGWSDQECAECHQPEARAHALSAHARARESFVFQAGVRDEEPRWCVGCHAPLGTQPASRAPPDASPEEQGIGCAACHAGREGVLTTRLSAETTHALELSPSLRDGTLCAGCHQFGFLRADAGTLSSTDMQQDTLRELRDWQRQTGEQRDCWACHERGSGHALSGHRPVEALRAAVEVRVAPGVVELSLREVGHALPTGDVMRWLGVEFSSDGFFDSRARPAASFGLELGEGAGRDGHFGVRRDTRLRPGQVARVPVPPGARVAQVVYHLVSAQQERNGAMPASLSRVVLHTREVTEGR